MSRSDHEMHPQRASPPDVERRYANFSYGVTDTRKRSLPVAGQAILENDDALLFEFLERMVAMAPVTRQALNTAAQRTRQKMTKEKHALYDHVLAHLNDNAQVLTFSEQQYLTLMRQTAASQNQAVQTVVTADYQAYAGDLERGFGRVMQYLQKDRQLVVLQHLLKRLSSDWRATLEAGVEPPPELPDNLFVSTLKAYHHQQRNSSLVLPFTACSVCVDPQWDERLPVTDSVSHASLLQQIICMLARELSQSVTAFYLTRVTQSMNGYKVWLVNVAQSDSLLTLRMKVTDLANVDRALLVQHPHTAFPQFVDATRLNRIQSSVNHIAVLAETEVIENAKLENGIHMDDDPMILQAKQAAEVRQRELEQEIHRLDETLKTCWATARPEVSQRVQAISGYENLARDIDHLKAGLSQWLAEQQQAVVAQQQALQSETQKLITDFQHDIDNIAEVTARSLANLLLQAIHHYLDMLTEARRESAFKEVVQLLALPVQADFNALSTAVYQDLQIDFVLTASQRLLQSNHLILRDQVEHGVEELQKRLPAIEYSKTKKCLAYNPERYVDQQRHHYARILDEHRQGLLQRIEHVGYHGDLLETFRGKVQQLTKSFENEQANHNTLMPVCDEIDAYHHDIMNRLAHEREQLQSQIAASAAAQRLFPDGETGLSSAQLLQAFEQIVQTIDTALRHLHNLAVSLHNPKASAGEIRLPEARIQKNKDIIVAALDELRQLQGVFADTSQARLQQQSTYDDLLRAIYDKLKTIVLDAAFLEQCQVKGLVATGDKVNVAQTSYKVHRHIGAVIRAVQAQVSDSHTVSPELGLQTILAAYNQAAQGLPAKGMFTRHEERPVPGTPVGDVCAQVAALNTLTNANGPTQLRVLAGVLKQLTTIAQKHVTKPSEAREERRFLTDPATSKTKPRSAERVSKATKKPPQRKPR